MLGRGTRYALLALRSDSHGNSGGGWQSCLAALLRQACGKSQRCDEACKRKEAQRHPCARKRRAPQGGPSDFRRLYERSACGAQRVPPDSRRQTRFFGDFLVADKKVTRPPGRTPGLRRQNPQSVLKSSKPFSHQTQSHPAPTALLFTNKRLNHASRHTFRSSCNAPL